MIFTTPCFVRVEDAEMRKELIEWLIGVGYECVYGGSVDDNLISCYGDSFGVDYKSHMGCHNCGDNIALFKALAAMNDENYREQWFISNVTIFFNKLKGNVETANGERYLSVGDWFKPLVENPKFKFIGRAALLFRKATAEEIIEHFKQH